MKFNRIFLLVCDSLGVGEALDAIDYGDNGANTLGHINEACNLYIPNLKKLGFLDVLNMNENKDVEAYYTIARPLNKGKDTLSGHYEMMGIKTTNEFVTMKNGLPIELINEIERYTGRKVIGNITADDLDIIRELGLTQAKSGALIIYTSLDSSIKVAAHEKVIPLEELYRDCKIIRKLTEKKEWRVGRVIAKPFTGNTKSTFKLTNNAQVYPLDPPKETVLDSIKEKGLDVIAIGKTYNVFNGHGITKKVVSKENKETINKMIDLTSKKFKGLCFANLDDFDSLYGHKRDVKGYAEAIEALDVEIPIILNKLNNDDLLIITADHGNDPTFKGNDHTRENVPVIIYNRLFKEPKNLPILSSLADIGATISDNFDIEKKEIGESFLDKLK